MVEGLKFRESHVFENTKLESKEGRNASTFSKALLRPLAEFPYFRPISCFLFPVDHTMTPAVTGRDCRIVSITI